MPGTTATTLEAAMAYSTPGNPLILDLLDAAHIRRPQTGISSPMIIIKATIVRIWKTQGDERDVILSIATSGTPPAAAMFAARSTAMAASAG
jgi:hypothetical protein